MLGLWIGIRFPSFGTHSSYPQGERSGGRGERKPPLPPDYRKERWGLRGRDSSLPRSVVPARNSVCQPPHRILGGGVRRNLKLGEGAEPPPAVRFGNRFSPNPFRNSFPRIPYGILILTDGTNGWKYVSHCLELILLTLWDREEGVWGRGNFLFPRITKKRRGGLGGEIPPSPERRGECRLTSFASPPFIPREPLIPPST